MTIFLFPGRSSRYPEMISRTLDAWPVAAEIISYASRILGRDLHRQYRSDNRAIFESEQDIQVGVFLATHLHMRALEANGATAKLSLGLGVGEFNHLVHIGALEFEEALRLVDTRAAAFSQVPQGPMLVVRSVPVEAVEAVLPLARRHGVVELVIHVSPEQHVIAGSQAAVEAAEEELRRRHPSVSFKMLEVQHPAFGSLLAPAGKALQEAMASVKWKLASAPYIPNVLGTPVLAYTPEMYTEFLSRQVHSPIRWRQSIEFLAEREPDAIFAAVGPRSTTFDLIPDNWIANRRVKTDRPGDLARSFVHTAVELARRA